MPTTNLIFQEVKSTKSRNGNFVLIRRPAKYTNDGKRTVGKIRPVHGKRGSWKDPYVVVGWRLEINGQDTLSMEEVAEVYLAMTEMMESVNAQG